MPEIDVVIATRDRPAPLARCLEHLARQSFTDFEVIVVDDGSTTPIEETLPTELRERLTLRILRNEESGGPARARNRGIADSQATYIAFVDDDVCVDPELLALHHTAAEAHPGRVAVIGSLSAPADWRPTPWNDWEARQLEVEYRRMVAGEYGATWRQFHTGNAFVERAAVLEVGGFDERFTRAEDIELALRMHQRGVAFYFEPRAIGWHYAHRTLAAWRLIPQRYARTDVAMDRLHPDTEWLPNVQRELSRRHPLLRAMRLGLGRGPLRPAATALATASAQALYRLGARRTALYALSMVYDLEYQGALREAMRRPGVALVLSEG
jgi:GT2 family glycosyltransferase